MKYLIIAWSLAYCTFNSYAAENSKFYVCKSTYALCTTAPCKPVKGQPDVVSCKCSVKNGYSASQQPCNGEKETIDGKLIFSRYYPVHSYKVCSNNRVWAYCLDKPCVIDKNDPTKANCACSPKSQKGDYVMVTDGGATNSCDKGITSSATVKQAKEITTFLKSQNKLQPFKINVKQ